MSLPWVKARAEICRDRAAAVLSVWTRTPARPVPKALSISLRTGSFRGSPFPRPDSSMRSVCGATEKLPSLASRCRTLLLNRRCRAFVADEVSPRSSPPRKAASPAWNPASGPFSRRDRAALSISSRSRPAAFLL